MFNKLIYNLIHLSGLLSTQFPEVYNEYLSHSSKEEISALLKNYNIANNEIVQIYELFKGKKVSTNSKEANLYFCSFGFLIPVEQAINFMTDWNKNYIDIDLKFKNKFPIMTDCSGDFLAIDLDITSPTYGKIIYMAKFLLNGNFISIFDSPNNLFGSILECFEKKVYSYNDANNLVFDENLEYEIFKNENPNSDYWKE